MFTFPFKFTTDFIFFHFTISVEFTSVFTRITAGTSFRDDGLNVAVVNIGPLASDKADHSVRCKVTYTADPNHHLQGGVITSNSVKVNVIHVTSFVLPSTIAVTGDTVTLSCSATGETQPTFKFTAEGSPFSAEYYTEVAAASSVVDGGDGNVWNSEYKFSVKSPNMIVNGETVACEVETQNILLKILLFIFPIF